MQRFGHEIFDFNNYQASMRRAVRRNRGFLPYEITVGLSDEQAGALADWFHLSGEDQHDEGRLAEAAKALIETVAQVQRESK